MNLNQKGITQYIIIASIAVMLVSAVTCYIFILKNKVLKSEITALEAKIAVLETANRDFAKIVAKERVSHAKAIKFYQDKLDECLTEQKECVVVKIEGCPSFKIEDKGSEMLLALQQIWRW